MGFGATFHHDSVYDELRKNGMAADKLHDDEQVGKPIARPSGRRMQSCDYHSNSHRSDDSISAADIIVTGAIIGAGISNDDWSGGSDYDGGSSFDSGSSSGWD